MQARPGFLQGCGLPAAWAWQPRWCILETGFGLGLNFLQTWAAWQADPARPELLHFIATEANPVKPGDLLQAAQAHTEQQALAQALSQQFRGLLPGVHRLVFEGGRVLLTLCVGEAQAQLKDQRFVADSVFLGGLNGGSPDLGDLHMLKAVARCCRRGTRLAASASASSLVNQLRQCGFEVDASSTPDCDQLQARLDPAWESKTALPTEVLNPGKPGHCLVIGAGLAGAATAFSLAKRGWRVTVLDAGDGPAAGASGLPVGLLAPHTSPDDSHLSRLSRSGLRATWQSATEHLVAGRDFEMTGVLQRRFEARDGAGNLPTDWPEAGQHWSQQATAEQLSEVQEGDEPPALWHGAGGWIRPAQLVRALLAQPGIQTQWKARVTQLEKQAKGWRALGAEGQSLAEADMVVLTSGVDGAALARPWLTELPLQPIRGQVSWGSWRASENTVLPPFAVNGNGSFVPAFPHGEAERSCWLLGATFERDQTDTDLRAGDQLANFSKLQTLLPETAASLGDRFKNGDIQAWAGVRCASPDRLPLVGALDAAQAPGLWACTALGSRGLTFAVLCGELLAAWLHAEPLPLEARLAQALRADRFARRAKLAK